MEVINNNDVTTARVLFQSHVEVTQGIDDIDAIMDSLEDIIKRSDDDASSTTLVGDEEEQAGDGVIEEEGREEGGQDDQG